MRKIFTLLAALATTGVVYAETVTATWAFGVEASAVDPIATVSSTDISGQLTVGSELTGGNLRTAKPSTGDIPMTGYKSNATAGYQDGEYLDFTITPAATLQYAPTNLSFNVACSKSQSSRCSIQVISGEVTKEIAAEFTPVRADQDATKDADRSFNTSFVIEGIEPSMSPVVVRICLYGSDNKEREAMISDVVITGDVTPGDTRDSAPLSWSAAEVKVALGSAFDAPELSNEKALTVTYASSNEEVATISEEGIVNLMSAGTTEISAVFAGNEEYMPATVSYTLKVIDPNAIETAWLSWESSFSQSAVLNFANGFVLNMDLSDGQEKYYMSGSKTSEFITTPAGKLKTIKVSNGRANELVAPEGMVITSMTIYSIWNAAKEGARDTYWKSVAGVDYEYNEQTAINVTDGATPHIDTYTINNMERVSFCNTGEQVVFVVYVEYKLASEVIEAPAAPVIECDALNGEGEIEGQGDGTPVTVAFSHVDGADIYYNFTPVVAEETPDTPAEQDAEPTVMVDGKEYTLYTEPITLTKAGELSYFARKNGLDSEIKTVTVKSIASALFEINADENAPVEYFNLQGIRVANPDNGVFIRRQGNTVTKVVK